MKGICAIMAILICMAGSSSAEDGISAEHRAQRQENIMQLVVGSQHFEVDMVDTVAARRLIQQLPVVLDMKDHLNNEKFSTLAEPLPTADTAVGQIEVGDIMLWQGDTVVVFYERFRSAYRYTRLGRVRDTANLKAALGGGSVRVRLAP